MKTKILKTIGMIAFCFFVSIFGYTQTSKAKIAVLNIDSRNVPMTSHAIGDLVRMELEKFDTFEVIDRYDVKDRLDNKQINYEGAYGKQKLVNIGDTLAVDWMLTGTVEKLGDIIVVTYRLIDVKKNQIVKTHLIEYIDNDKELTTMVKTTLKSMFNKPIEEVILDKLTKRYDYDNQINNPNATRLVMGGPRIGFSTIWGENANLLRKHKDEGGYDAEPYLSQFGYQFEFQYLNTKRFQALLEFIPMISGIEQNIFKPNLVMLNGFRDSKTGWEFGIGPFVGIASKTDFVQYQGTEMRLSDFQTKYANEPTPRVYRKNDSRGNVELDFGVMIAFGKTFKSGKLNIPINLFVTIPTKDGFMAGISFGYNAKTHVR